MFHFDTINEFNKRPDPGRLIVIQCDLDKKERPRVGRFEMIH